MLGVVTDLLLANRQMAPRFGIQSGHPVIPLAEPGECWLYCYPDDAFAEY